MGAWRWSLPKETCYLVVQEAQRQAEIQETPVAAMGSDFSLEDLVEQGVLVAGLGRLLAPHGRLPRSPRSQTWRRQWRT